MYSSPCSQNSSGQSLVNDLPSSGSFFSVVLPSPKAANSSAGLCTGSTQSKGWSIAGKRGGSHGEFAWPNHFHPLSIGRNMRVIHSVFRKGEVGLTNKPISTVEMIYFLVSYCYIISSAPKMAFCQQPLSPPAHHG